MKKTFLASIAFATITLSATAQQERKPDSLGRSNRPPMEGRMGGNNEQLVKELNLTPAQAEQWKKANEERKAKMEELRNSNLSREERREKMKVIMDEHKVKTDAFLTAEQKEKVEAARKKMMEERGNRPEGSKPGGN